MHKPKVSIIVPVYNVAPYIRRCLACLAMQTLTDIEIICIDDKGNDTSFEIAEEFAQNDARFKLVYNPKNLGIALSEKKGLELAKGEYVGFVDPDDWVDLTYYEKLYTSAKQKKSDIAKADRVMVYADATVDNVHMNQRILQRIEQGMTLFSSWTFGWTTAIYRKNFLDEHHIQIPQLNLGFDVVFLSEVLSCQPTCVLIEDVFYYYLQRYSSITKKVNEYTCQSWMLYILKICLLALKVPMQRSEYLEFIAHKITTFMRQLELFSKIKPEECSKYQELLAQTLFVSPYLSNMYISYPKTNFEWSEIMDYINQLKQPLSVEELSRTLDHAIAQLNAVGDNNEKR